MNLPLAKEELRAEIMLGVESLKAGRSKIFYSEDAIFQEIKKRGQKKLKIKQQRKK